MDALWQLRKVVEGEGGEILEKVGRFDKDILSQIRAFVKFPDTDRV